MNIVLSIIDSTIIKSILSSKRWRHNKKGNRIKKVNRGKEEFVRKTWIEQNNSEKGIVWKSVSRI